MSRAGGAFDPLRCGVYLRLVNAATAEKSRRDPSRRRRSGAQAPRGARLLLVILIAAALGAPPRLASAQGSERLREIVERWRAARGRDLPLETYLRPLVAADSAFRPDSTTETSHLGPEMRTAYEGLQEILAPELQRQFLGFSSDSLRAEWLRRYWKLRDPTPTTPENERQRTHEERVAHARTAFAWKEPPGWDDRGAIWIAFGAPDSLIEESASVEEGLGFVPGRQDWLYLGERWLVEFERPNPRGPWRLGRSSARLSWRPDLVSRDKARLGVKPGGLYPSDRERAGDLIGQQEDRTRLAQGDYEGMRDEFVQHEIRTDLRAKELLRKRQESLVRFRKQYETSGERFVLEGRPPKLLWYFFDVVSFRGPAGRMRVEVHYQFNLQDLAFAWKDSVYLASYRAEGVLLDRDAREVARDSYTERVRADEFRSTLSSQLVPGQLQFTVPEGTYRLSLRLLDLGSGGQATYVTVVDVPRLDGRTLALSDIQMASNIVYAGDDWRSRFVKHDRLVVPNPIAVFQRGRQLTGYYEIYGLRPGTDQVYRYEVRTTIAPRGLERVEGWFPPEGTYEKPFVTSSFQDEAGTSDLVQELRVDVGALASDTYDVVLTVRDLVAGTEATARSRFSILE